MHVPISRVGKLDFARQVSHNKYLSKMEGKLFSQTFWIKDDAFGDV